MANRTEYFRWTTGATIYAKPLPLTNSAWGDDDIAMAENGALGSYSASTLDEDTPYEIFLQAGGAPASTDLAIGSVEIRYASASMADSQLVQSTTIATLASQTSFTLTAGSADDDAYNGLTIIFIDSTTSVQKAVGTISDYTGSSKTVTLLKDPGIFTIAVGDTVKINAAVNGAPGSVTTGSGVGWLG